MKKPRIATHHYGFCIRFTHNVFFDMDINYWRFIPSIEFDRRPGVSYAIIFGFLCFDLTIYRWGIYKR